MFSVLQFYWVCVGVHVDLNVYQVEIIDYTVDYFAVLKRVFDFPALRAFIARPDPKFRFVFDAM
jgi:phosphoglucomutase